jgi:hypothetical protein
MRRVVVIPIIHTSADLGSLADAVRTHYTQKYGAEFWRHRERFIAALWEDIRGRIAALDLDYEKVRIYQDGLPACGFELQILRELAGAGSPNHQLVLDLIGRGAALIGTEDPQLLIREYQLQRRQMSAAEPDQRQPLPAPRELADLLEARDCFIAQRIAGTLQEGEVGLLFLGAAHPLAALRSSGIQLQTL